MCLVINQKKIFVRVRHDLDTLSLSDSVFAEKSKNHDSKVYAKRAVLLSEVKMRRKLLMQIGDMKLDELDSRVVGWTLQPKAKVKKQERRM